MLSPTSPSGAPRGACAMAWPVAPEQVAPLSLLLSPAIHGGEAPAYVETAISHMVVAGPVTYILRRPLLVGRYNLLTPEGRWHWCEDMAMQAARRGCGTLARPLPIARRDGRLHLGGPGDIVDWVLKRVQPAARPRCDTRPLKAPARPRRPVRLPPGPAESRMPA